MKTAAIQTMHLYGAGGGARAVAWFASALGDLGYHVDIYSSTDVPPIVRSWLPRRATLASSYPTCGRGYDLLFNIDHFHYVPPLAKRNWAHIFQPHEHNRPPSGYELWANSKYTAGQCQQQWGLEAKHIYIPISESFMPLRKRRWISHCSRIVAPSQYADKGHQQMIMAFLAGIMRGDLADWQFHIVGSVDPGMEEYLKYLKAHSQGYPIHFHLEATDDDIMAVLGLSSFYWHMTGITMKEIPGAQEHLGLTPIEAMAAGAVPICHKSGGLPETVHQSQTGFLVDSPGELLDVTIGLIRQPNVWAAVSEQAHRQGQAWQDYPAFVDRVASMFDSQTGEIPATYAPLSLFTEKDVTIVMPVYNEWGLTRQMLHSIVTTANPGGMILVDNGSTDATSTEACKIKNLTYLRLEKNRGFAGAIMDALPHVHTPLVMIVNNDMECLDSQWLSYLVSFMAGRVGIIGPKLLYPDGRLQSAGGLFDWSRSDIGFHRYYRYPDGPMANTVERVPFVTGAAMLIRKELVEIPSAMQKGLNYEDAHWCINAWHKGWEVLYAPCVRLIHMEARTKRAVETSVSAIKRNRAAFVKHWQLKWLDDPRLARVRNLNAQLVAQLYSEIAKREEQ